MIWVADGEIGCMISMDQEIPENGYINSNNSKGGTKMVKSIAKEVAPGAIRTPIDAAIQSILGTYADLMMLVPYKRISEPDDIARAVSWLASEAPDYATGALLFVDGRMSLYPGVATGR